MNTKESIRKILIATGWLVISGGTLTLLIAAISKKNRELCRGYTISIKGAQHNFFADQKDISALLTRATETGLKGKRISSINLRRLEQLLEENAWIRDAELWFDNKEILHIKVNEREPVARIFTVEGHSFYIDSSKKMMPLSDKMSARVPVFTGFPDKRARSKKDRLLLAEIKTISEYILRDSFWNSQAAQIDITPERNFEMAPVIGNHIVKLGDGKEIDKKLGRLMLFYKQVMSKTGFDVYSIVDVQYAGQVIGTRKKTAKTVVDSAQLRKNIEKLLKQTARQMQIDSTSVARLVKEKAAVQTDSLKITITDRRATNIPSTNPNLMKTTSLPKHNENKPKAIMPQRRSEL
jgi:cell division protein FtsQ